MPRAASIAPATLIETGFDKGVISDADASVLATGQVTASDNMMMDKAGLAYKRGGSVQVGGTAGTSGITRVDIAEFPHVNKNEYLAWSTDLHLYRNISGTWTSTSGTYGSSTGYLPRMKPAMVADSSLTTTGGKMIWGISAGNDYPMVYEGNGTAPRVINVATGLGPDYGGRYMVFYKGRLALAASTKYENRMWFSPDIVTGVETAWDLTNAYIDFDYNITGLAALQNVLLVFSRNHVVRLSGSAPPPGGNMSEGPVGDTGCTDSRSICVWNDQAIWANPNGVYMSSGTGIVDLTNEGGFKRQWQSSVPSFDESATMITAGIYKNYYWVTVGNSTTYVLDIPRRVWWKVTLSQQPNSYCADVLTGKNFYISDGFQRVLDIAPTYTPSSSYRTDVGSSTISASLTTRVLHGGQVGLKGFRDGRLRYKLNSATSVATCGVTVTEANDGATVNTATLAEFGGYDREVFPISADSEGIQVAISQANSCDLFELYGMEIDYRPLPLSRGGAL